MKDIFGAMGKIIGLVFGALVIGYTGYLTWLLAARLVPGNTILQAMTLALFDGGALVWFVLFLTQARGTMQWAIAGLGFAIGLIGAVIMAAGELILGQQLVIVEDNTQIGWILIATVIVAALTHATLTYSFHFSNPDTHNRIENAQKISSVKEKAYATARAEIERMAEDMGKDLASSLVYQARAELAAQALPHLRRGANIESGTAETRRGLFPAGGPSRHPAVEFASDTELLQHKDVTLPMSVPSSVPSSVPAVNLVETPFSPDGHPKAKRPPKSI